MLLEFICSHLRVIVAILSALGLYVETSSGIQGPIVLVTTRHEDVVVRVVATYVVHAIVESVLLVFRSQTVEVLIVVIALHIV